MEAGVATLVGNEKERIIEGCEWVLNRESENLKKINPYGDGKAAGRILKALYKSQV